MTGASRYTYPILKVVVLAQSLALTILGAALYNDYLHNVYLRIFVQVMLERYLVAYSAIVGVSLGMILASSATLLQRRVWRGVKAEVEAPSSIIGSSAISLGVKRIDEVREDSSSSEIDLLTNGIPGLPLLGTPLRAS